VLSSKFAALGLCPELMRSHPMYAVAASAPPALVFGIGAALAAVGEDRRSSSAAVVLAGSASLGF
jgi:hypothetical protein